MLACLLSMHEGKIGRCTKIHVEWGTSGVYEGCIAFCFFCVQLAYGRELLVWEGGVLEKLSSLCDDFQSIFLLLPSSFFSIFAFILELPDALCGL